MKKITFGARPTTAAARPDDIDAWVIDRAHPPTPAPAREPTKRLTIDVPVSLHRRIKTTCAIENVVIADVVRGLLERRFPVERADLGAGSGAGAGLGVAEGVGARAGQGGAPEHLHAAEASA